MMGRLFWEGLDGFSERTSARLWMQLAAHAGVIFDIGAYLGIYSLLAGRVNPQARIVAFEPQPPKAEAVREQVRLNGLNVTCVQAAACDRVKRARLGYHPRSQAIAYLAPDEHDGPYIEVTALTLDGYAAEQGIDRLDLMKIDVEEQEHVVLAGAQQLLHAHRPTLLIEIKKRSLGDKLIPLLPSGYRFFAIDEMEGTLRPAPRLDRSGPHSLNMLLCPEGTVSAQLAESWSSATS